MAGKPGEQDAEVEQVVDGENGEGTGGPDDIESELEGADAAEHPDDQEDDGESGAIDEAAPAKPSRGEGRIQRLANEAKAAREEAAETRRQLQELQRSQHQATQQLTKEQEEARLLLMTPEERGDYKLNRAEQRFAQQASVLAFQTQDQSDRAMFAAKAVSNKVYAKYQDEVESKLQELRSQGQNVPREQLLKWIIGDKALAGAPVSTRKAQEKGQQRVNQQRVAPSNAKGDAASQRGKTPDSAEKRLAGQFI